MSESSDNDFDIRRPNKKHKTEENHLDDIQNKPSTSQSQIAPKPVCSICRKEYTKYYNLYQHQRKCHPLHKETLQFQLSKVQKKSHACNVCPKTFSRKDALSRHEKNAHTTHVSQLQPQDVFLTNSKKSVCDICEKEMSTNYNLKIHKEKIHGIIQCQSTFFVNLKCSICKSGFPSKESFINHLTNIHDVAVSIESLEFESRGDFEDWKCRMEKETASRYILKTKYVTKNGLLTTLYNCHRNGHYIKKGSGKRHLKIGGTNKIEYFCPSSIFVKAKSIGESFSAKVKFISTHVGHKCEVGKLGLSKQEKEQIAGQILSGVPLQNVLIKISEDASPTKRIAATNIQDLRNISTKYGANSNVIRFREDVLSVETWANQMISSESNPILLYKLVGENNEDFPDLEQDDFVLGFMNDAQEEIFKIYGNDVVSIDSTHGTNQYNIQLTSIIIRDDNVQGFPVAFMWSNRQTEKVYEYFFLEIKKRINNIEAKTFMSDDYPAFYNAWKTVFGEVSNHLICDWHVKRAISKNISTGPNQITNEDKRQSMINAMFSIVNELDENTFKKLLSIKLSEMAKDPEMANFGSYFEKNYMHRTAQWAACYRLNANINTNMAAERWHRELKYNSDLKGKCGGRLDKAIHSLMKSLRLKLLDRLSSLQRGKLTKKIVAIRKAHVKALDNLNCEIYECANADDDISNIKNILKTHIVPSFSTAGETYKVHTLNLKEHRCNLTCNECKQCIHRYRCSCAESAIKYNFCKHIHLVCLKEKSTPSENEIEVFDDEEVGLLEIDLPTVQEKEKTAIAEEFLKEKKNNFQEETKSAVLGFLSKLEKYSNKEQCTEIIKTIAVLTHKCEALEKRENKKLPLVTKVVAANKNIECQRKFPQKQKRDCKRKIPVTKLSNKDILANMFQALEKNNEGHLMK